MQRVLAIICSIACALSLVACGGKPAGNEAEPLATQGEEREHANTSRAPSRHEDLQVTESTYWLDVFGWMTYGVLVHNPNDSIAAQNVALDITYANAAGPVDTQDHQVIAEVLPGETIAVASSIAGSGMLTAGTVPTFTLDTSQSSWHEAKPAPANPYTLSGFSVVPGTVARLYEGKETTDYVDITGSVTRNDESSDYENYQVVVFFYDTEGVARHVGLYAGYGLEVGAASSFEFPSFHVPQYASYKVFVSR